MAILSGSGRVHLNGHKELTKDLDIRIMPAPDIVYVPLAMGTNNEFEVLVKAGDYVKKGTRIAFREDIYVPVYAPVSGSVRGVEKRMHVSGRPQPHLVIVNDHEDASEPLPDFDVSSAAGIVTAMKESGLVGLGGSGFPTFLKYQNVQNITTILINGVECEPYLTSDHVAMKKDADKLFKGLRLMMQAAHAEKGIVAIKEHKPDLLEILKNAAAPGVEVVEVPDRYPMGWERTLVKQVTKKDYVRLPSEVGVIVNNASTAIALANAVYEHQPITERIVTLSGDGVKNPGNILAAVGTPIKDIVAFAGGYSDAPEGIVLNGGPMMGNAVMNDNVVITSYTNGLTCLIKKEEKSWPCLKCGMCVDHCPAHLQPVKIVMAEKTANLEYLEKLCVSDCIECGTCSYVCPSKIEVTDFVKKAKRRLNMSRIVRKAAGE